MTQWIKGKILKIIYWNDRLFSIFIKADVAPFIAGQFTKLKLNISDKIMQRAYSYVNAPINKNLEFYISLVNNGKFSNALYKLKPGNSILISKYSKGVFIIKEIPRCENLWMFATGTGIGPYLSILEEINNLDKFDTIILVHAVSFYKDLSYLPKMLRLKDKYNKKLHIQTIISRENINGSLYGYIPNLIENGTLEKKLNIQIKCTNSHIMLCGNPNMIKNTLNILKTKKNMKKHFINNKGHITSEQYW
ncbi:MAG: FAD-binding oxidoreductase [Enterobacterales bacterium]